MMKRRWISLFIAVLTLMLVAWGSFARKAPEKHSPKRYIFHEYNTGSDMPLDARELFAAAVVETFVLADFDFDGPGMADPQGWFGVDLTAPMGVFFHVDDFSGLNGGDFGGLVPIEETQSLWCGARPNASDTYLCSYKKLPGYGNSWSQRFQSVEFATSGDVTLSFKAHHDTEPYCDYTYVQYRNKDGAWVDLLTLDGDGDITANLTVPADSLDGSVIFRFSFDSDDAWSDQDGMYNSDGAIVIDSVLVSDTTSTLDYQDFESEAVGDTATADGDWYADAKPSYGDFAGLFPGSAVLQEDPCVHNFSFLWGFFKGSTVDMACAGHPAQKAVPYGKEVDGGMLYLTNEVWSPLIDWDMDIYGSPVPSDADAAYFEIDVYEDNPFLELVAFIWRARTWIGGCPGDWRDRAWINFGWGPRWQRWVESYADLIDPGAEQIQLALGCYDLCGFYCNPNWQPDCHRHGPLYDNVRFIRVRVTGPQFSVRDVDLFNDTFPEGGDSLGTARIDAAIDITSYLDGHNVPGDSAIITVSEPTFGLGSDPNTAFGSAVYFYLSRDPQSKPMPLDKIVEDSYRWPVVDSVLCNSRKWYMFRCDTAFTESGGPRTGPAPDRFCIDVNDHFFTNGDTLWFFFGATDANATSTWWSQFTGTVDDIEEACVAPMEMQILPGAGVARGGDVLYVDQFDGRGAEPYFNSAFEMMGIMDYVDRFDKRGPTSLVGNGVAGRVTSVVNQLHPYYRGMIWCSGDLGIGTVGDGSANETDDFTMLDFFLDQHPNPLGAGIYFSGDNMASEWETLTNPSSSNFIGKFIPYQLVDDDHTVSFSISPLVIGEDGGIFDAGIPLEEDTIVAYGGCPGINDFDVIRPVGSTTLEMTYGGSGDPNEGAVVAYDTMNAQGNRVAMVLSGFSFHYIRDDRPAGVPDRADHFTDVHRFLWRMVQDPSGTDATPQHTNSLAQNYPNPFNPSTTIKYSIKERASVSLKIYNVAGQLVKTLVNEEKPAGEYTKGWNARNDAGQPVSSGVYFYRLQTKGFTRTKKMVVLK